MNEELLRPYQIEGINWLKKQNNCLLADSQGIGKTSQILFSLDLNKRTIVVAPTQVLFNWIKEIQFWKPEFKSYIIKSKKDFRLPEVGEIVIVSYGMLPSWVAPPKGKRKVDIPEDVRKILKETYLVFDEVHRVANNKSNISRNSKYLSRLCFKTVGASGTPIRNSPYDLWNLLHVLGVENLVFKDFFHFLKSYGGTKGMFGWQFPKQPKVSAEVSERLKKVMLRRLKEDIFDQLPNEIYIPIYVDDSSIREELNSSWELLRNLKGFSEGEIPDFVDMAKTKALIAKNNIPKMLEIVEEYEEENIPLIVGSDHVAPIEALQERPGWKIIKGGMSPQKKFEAAEDFQNGKLKGIGIVLKAGSEGINLFYGSHILFNDRHWTPQVNEQFIARINRIGQKQNKLFIKDIIHNHPLTEHIYKQNIRKMTLSYDSIEHNQGFTNLREEKEKPEEVSMKDVILSCVPEWEKRFENYSEEIISGDIKNYLSDYEFKTRSGESIISLLSIVGYEDKGLLSLAKKILSFDKL